MHIIQQSQGDAVVILTLPNPKHPGTKKGAARQPPFCHRAHRAQALALLNNL